MRKKILFAPLWGIFALSLLSSCRTEDGAMTQKQIEDKRFAVFVPKGGKTVNYANGFASLMKKYDQVHFTNISGINNKPIIKNLSASANKSVSSFQDIGKYVEFNVRSQTVIEGNGNKWVAFPKVENEKVTGLIIATLRDKETQVVFTDLDSNDQFYTENLPLFQQALDRYLSKKKSKLNVVASIKNGAIASVDPGADPGTDPPAYETDIEGVTVKGKPKPSDNGTNGLPTGPSTPIACEQIQGCYNPAETGGGSAFPNPSTNPNQEIINNLKDYPCAQKLLQDLKTDLNNDLAKLIVNTLGDDNKSVQVNFFGEEFDDSQLNGQTRRVDKIGDKIMKFDIALSKDMLQNATQEYVLATMYHEFVHAYLGYQFKALGADVYHAKYPYIESYIVGGVTKFRFKTGDHQAFTPFVNMIADALRTYNPNIPSKVATALAMKGLIDEESPNPYLPDGADLINQQERKSDKYSQGTKCAKQ